MSTDINILDVGTSLLTKTTKGQTKKSRLHIFLKVYKVAYNPMTKKPDKLYYFILNFRWRGGE